MPQRPDISQAARVSEALDLSQGNRPPIKVRQELNGALVLASPVAKGAYEAGALFALARRGVSFSRIAGTGAGAFDAVLAGAGLACGRFGRAATIIAKLWQTEAVLAPGNAKALGENGTHIERLLCESLEEIVTSSSGEPEEALAPIEGLKVALVTARICAGRVPRLRYETPVWFGSRELLDRNAWGGVAHAAASAMVPNILDQPEADGPAASAGVFDAPLWNVLDNLIEGAVLVVFTEPLIPGDFSSSTLVERLVNERMVRDIADAMQGRQMLSQSLKAIGFDKLAKELSPVFARGTLRRAQSRLGRDCTLVIPVRPRGALCEPTPGVSQDAHICAEYLRQGEEAARSALREVD
jgi:hypothetical protein